MKTLDLLACGSLGGAARSGEDWRRVGCLLCHNVQIYCPVVLCLTGLLVLCGNVDKR